MTKSNSHAKVPDAYYVDTMKELEICPKLLQTDFATETVLMAAIQSRLQTSVHTPRYSSSIADIRIENWWSHNRKEYTGWLIDFFKDMVATGEFNLGKTLHMEPAWYTFSPLLQYKLDQVKLQWNTLYIRRTRHDTIPGRPDELFFLPELSAGQKQGTNISSDSEIDSAYSNEENLMEDAKIVMNDGDEEYFDVEYFEYVVHKENLLYPSTN